jgi:hypothetical protein
MAKSVTPAHGLRAYSSRMTELNSSGFAEFDRLGVIFRHTRALLDEVAANGDLPDGGTAVLANESLPYVEDVEEGFRLRLRASAAELSELRELVRRAGLAGDVPRSPAEQRAALIEGMQRGVGAPGEPDIVPAPARRLAAIDHARLVFALLPATPAGDVHYPHGLRSYADIASPRSPAELATRIEELERSLWAVATGRRPRLSDSRYRRTYGFFDAAERMSSRGLLTS